MFAPALYNLLSPQGPAGPQGPLGYPGPRGVKVRWISTTNKIICNIIRSFTSCYGSNVAHYLIETFLRNTERYNFQGFPTI